MNSRRRRQRGREYICEALTNCEQEILELLSDGQSNEVIAATLFISVRIVEHHVCAIPSNRRASTRERAAKDQAGLDRVRTARRWP